MTLVTTQIVIMLYFGVYYGVFMTGLFPKNQNITLIKPPIIIIPLMHVIYDQACVSNG